MARSPAALALFALALLAGCSGSDRPAPGDSEPAPPTKPHRIGAVARPPSPDSPGEALAWRMLRWRDEHGRIAPDALPQALRVREQIAAADDGGVAPTAWVERGPSNISGRTRSLIIDPRDPNHLIAGSVGGGMWRSTDRAATWEPVDDWQPRLPIGCLTRDPSDPDVIWCGTGEGYFNSDALRGDGIYRSVDNGQTFAKLTATDGWSYVNRIAVSATDPLLVLAARDSGLFRTTDGGQSWTQVWSGETAFQVLFDPNVPTRAIASGRAGGAHSVLRSTDSGATWQPAQTGLVNVSGFNSRIELAAARSSGGWFYANCGANNGEIWRSTDGGATWSLRTGNYGNGAGWYYNTIWVAPTDANLVVFGSYYIYRSTNGGSSYTRISEGYIDTIQPHVDEHVLVEDPQWDGSTNRTLYVTTDGGVYRTSDVTTASRVGNSNWARLDNQYRTTQFYGAAGHGPTGVLIGGTQDNGTIRVSTLFGTTGNLTFGGDGGFCAIDWQDPRYTYGEYVRLQLHRSTNGGSSASYIYSGIADAGSSANFIAPFILDPNDPRRLLAGGRRLWRTNNARAATVSWQAIKPDVGSNISAIAVAPGQPDVVWVGHNDGRVYRSANATAASPTWVPVDDNGAADPLPDRYVARVVADHRDPNAAWVALGGFSPDNVWYTNDAGATFAVRAGSGLQRLPPAPVNGLCQHPTAGDVLYAGTEVGVFASEDGGATWSTNNLGPNNCSIDEVVFMNQSETLLAATHGRGLFTAAIVLPGVADLGPGCSGSTGSAPALALASPAEVGGTLYLSVTDLVPGQPAWFLLGFSGTVWNGTALPYDLGALGAPGCALRSSADLTFQALVAGDGRSGLLQPIPGDPALAGGHLFLQVLGGDPAANPRGVIVSNGLDVRVGR